MQKKIPQAFIDECKADRRICIIGASGADKSVLAKALLELEGGAESDHVVLIDLKEDPQAQMEQLKKLSKEIEITPHILEDPPILPKKQQPYKNRYHRRHTTKSRW